MLRFFHTFLIFHQNEKQQVCPADGRCAPPPPPLPVTRPFSGPALRAAAATDCGQCSPHTQPAHASGQEHGPGSGVSVLSACSM